MRHRKLRHRLSSLLTKCSTRSCCKARKPDHFNPEQVFGKSRNFSRLSRIARKTDKSEKKGETPELPADRDQSNLGVLFHAQTKEPFQELEQSGKLCLLQIHDSVQVVSRLLHLRFWISGLMKTFDELECRETVFGHCNYLDRCCGHLLVLATH